MVEESGASNRNDREQSCEENPDYNGRNKRTAQLNRPPALAILHRKADDWIAQPDNLVVSGNLSAALLSVGTGLAYAIAQPGWIGGSVWPVAFVCAIPLLMALRGRRVLARLALGWLAGTAATCFSTVIPAAVSSSSYLGVPMWQAVAIALTVGQVFGAGSFAAFAVFAGTLDDRRAAVSIARVAVAWTAAEYLRSTLFTGLPWILLAHALVTAPALLQPAAWFGAPGVTFLVAAANAAAFFVLSGVAPRARIAAILCLVAVAAVFGAAYVHSASSTVIRPGAVFAAGEGGDTALRVMLVQGNLRGQDGAVAPGIASDLARLTGLSSIEGVDLAIWPESSVRAVFPANLQALQMAWPRDAARPRHLVVGAPRSDVDEPTEIYNSVFLLGEDLEIEASHDKVHLLPIFEYVPTALRALGFDGRSTAAGTAPRVLASEDGLRIGALVCFEIAFDGLARASVRDSPDLLVNISNDGWFARTGAVEQHFGSAVLRAVEIGRPVLRATDTGVTAAIDAWGSVVARAPQNEPTTLLVDVERGGPSTMFAATGNVLGPTSLAAALGWLAWGLFPSVGRNTRSFSR